VGAAALRRSPQPPITQVVRSHMLNDIVARDAPIILVPDGYHAAAEADSASCSTFARSATQPTIARCDQHCLLVMVLAAGCRVCPSGR
jgi:hypothetical protein